MSRLLFVADLHGNRYAYEKALELARDRNVDSIVFGGDLTPKKIAVKLKDKEHYEDYTEESDEEEPEITQEPEITPGEVIPLHMVKKDEKAQTYTLSLEEIKALNEKSSPDELARGLENQGHIVFNIDNAFYNLEEMIEENRVIDKLVSFFRTSPGTGRRFTPLDISEDEIRQVEDVIIPALRKYEQGIGNGRRDTLARKWNLFLNNELKRSFGGYSFSRLAPSSTLLNYILFRDKLDEVERQHGGLVGVIDSSDEEVATLFREVVSNTLLDIRLAIGMGESFDDIYMFGNISDETPVVPLMKIASEHDVYVQGQRDFTNGYLRNLLRQFRQKTGKRVYGILGNDDVTEVEKDVRRLDSVENLIGYMNMQTLELDKGLWLAGYPFVRPSRSSFYAGWEKSEEEIKRDLDELAIQSDPRRTIYVAHSPPYGGSLDIAHNGEHIGSKSVRSFVEERQPLAVLSGHVHESFLKSGQVMERMGETYVFNPGGEHDKDILCAVVIDTDDIGNYERIYG